MSPISIAFAFIAGWLVVGAGVFVGCTGLAGLKLHSGARVAGSRVATSLGVIAGALALTAAGLYGVVAVILR